MFAKFLAIYTIMIDVEWGNRRMGTRPCRNGFFLIFISRMPVVQNRMRPGCFGRTESRRT